jgi:hypothetical protein
MEKTYAVSKRGPNGEPIEIHCEAHDNCSWRLQSTGPKRDDDMIFKAQFANHLRMALTPDVQAFGHLRRARL